MIYFIIPVILIGMITLPTIYKRDSRGNIQEWTVTVNGPEYFATEGIQGGKHSTTAPHICEAKSVGKKNATTAEEQALKEAHAVRDKKLAKGYVENLADVDTTTFEKPMKGYKWREKKDEVTWPITYQDKLNGVNFRIKSKGVESTGGKFYYTVPHIYNQFKDLFVKYPQAVFVGEGFNPKVEFLGQLTRIMNVKILPKDVTPELLAESEKIAQCWLFDGYGFNGITKKTPWLERIKAVAELVKGLKHVVVEEYKVATCEDDLVKAMEDNKARKGEGLMIRWGDCPIKHGKSKYMLKRKHMEDAEYKVVAIEEGNGDWKGCAKRIILELPEPSKDRGGNVITTFAANIRGDTEYLRELYENKDSVIGEEATVEYPSLSEYGIPQLCWVIAIRDYE